MINPFANSVYGEFLRSTRAMRARAIDDKLTEILSRIEVDIR